MITGPVDNLSALLARGAYYFVCGLVLALLEIQIEGKDGWAAKLPTWRLASPFIMRWFGRPLTGYMICVNGLLLLLMHLPVVYAGLSVALEAEVLAFFFFLAVFWDYQWFVWNPHFGVSAFRRGNVPWYRHWWGPLPVDYYGGIVMSALVYLAPAAFGLGTWAGRAIQWGAVFGEFVALTALTVLLARIAVVRAAPVAAPVRVEERRAS